MKFFIKKDNSTQENSIEPDVLEALPEPDDFDMPEPHNITHEDFKKLEENDTPEKEAEEAQDTIPDDDAKPDNEDNERPQADDLSIEAREVISDERNSIDVPFSEEKPQRMTFKEFYAKHKKGMLASIISAASVFILFCGIFIYGCLTITPDNVMGRNIYIEDVNVSGLSYDEALIKVKNSSLLKNRDITVISCGQSFTIDGIEAGLTARIEDTVDRAMRYGKTNNTLIDGFANTRQFFFKKTIIPSADVDGEVIRKKLYEFGNLIHGEKLEHQLEVGESHIICTPGHTGFSGNTDLAYDAVMNAIENERFSNIRVTLITAPPKPLTIETLDNFTYTDPQDARIEIANNIVTVVPEVWGRYLDKEESKTYLPQVYEGGMEVKIPYYKSEPAVKADDLNIKLFNGTIAQYSTNYGGSTANRSANIVQAASKINGKVLAPGEVFSFNDTVGPRSVANGFFTAPEYANGETIMGVGGGTCQVTTTLYNAVLYADLSIVSKLNHMFPVAYAPLGQDATVSDSGVDFKFMNNMEYPIKINATAQSGKLNISIVGTLRDDTLTVKLEHVAKPVGADTSVRSYRYVYSSQGELLRKDDLGKSYYLAH